jgi:exodeoxyribonuclease VII small subunit
VNKLVNKMAKEQKTEIPADIAKLSFEEAMAALEDIVRKLESGQVGLEQSIEFYSRGALMKRHCEDKLRAASERIDKIVLDENGQVSSTAPANME